MYHRYLFHSVSKYFIVVVTNDDAMQ